MTIVRPVLAAFVLAAACAAAAGIAAPVRSARPRLAPPAGPVSLARRYREGDSLRFHMEASSVDRGAVVRYGADVRGVVRRDSLGRFFEDLRWSNLTRNGQPVELTGDDASTRQRLTLAGDYEIAPDPAHTNPRLIGAQSDLFTMYSDLVLAAKQPGLRQAGDSVFVAGSAKRTWGDGVYVRAGEDALDLVLGIASVDRKAGTAQVRARHVPPAANRVVRPLAWMRDTTIHTPINWVQVAEGMGGRWVASAGRESLDVTLTVDLASGRLRAATLFNPIDVIERGYADTSFAAARDSIYYRMERRVTVK